MHTNQINFIIRCVIFVFITFKSVKCNQNYVIRFLPPVVYKANSNWFVKAEDVNDTVSDISQSQIVPLDRSVENLNTAELAHKYGYKVEEHCLTTKDLYKLTVFRIIGKGPVVFLMHEFLGSSDDFVVSGPGKALALLLADAGYDVWLGNARGNKYSRHHELLDPKFKTFWEFSWHQIGVFDLPKMVDHALHVTKDDQLTYIGHGQGTTVFFVLTSEKPEYNCKFDLMISLGTVAWTWHIESPVIRALVPITDSQFQLLENLGYYEIVPAGKSSRYCCTSKLATVTCITQMFNYAGYDYDQIDYDNVCLKLTRYPAGASLRQLQHYIQLIRSREFAQFDFGTQKNLATYRSKTPPSYDVEKINITIVIFYADNDWLSSLDDTLILVQRLPKVKKVYRVPHSKFNHFDYIYGKNANKLLYWKIIDILDEKIPEDKAEG